MVVLDTPPIFSTTHPFFQADGRTGGHFLRKFRYDSNERVIDENSNPYHHLLSSQPFVIPESERYPGSRVTFAIVQSQMV